MSPYYTILNKENVDGRQWLTTKEVLAEEKRLIDFVQDGKGKFKPLGSCKYQFVDPKLSDEQRNAVLHVLKSMDRVTAIRGGAGTGKTTMMREAVAAIESTGQKVFTFAPSAEASRGVLRSDAGFANAETVEALLQNQKLQAQVRGQVIWIDEAGLLGVRALARVADLAGKQNCRIILSGDTAQHRTVERGDALRLLEQHASLRAAELTEIRRQKANAHKAVVADLRSGNLEHAFAKLDRLGMLREMDAEDRHKALAADYVAAVKKGKSALVISPTHAEGERVTREIRAKLKAAKKLAADEYEFIQLKNLQWTEAQRADARNYQTNLVIQFHQNVTGFWRGERVTVSARNERGVSVVRANGEAFLLPLDMAARFQVYESRKIALVAGDMVQITQNGFTQDKQRLNNGDLKQVKDFTKDGDIKLSNGWVIAKDFGNLTHGYCLISYIPLLLVHAGHLRKDHRRVALLPQDAPNRSADLARRKDGGRHLIKQWLKKMVVCAVNQNDVRRRVLESLGSRQTAETTANDNHLGNLFTHNCSRVAAVPAVALRIQYLSSLQLKP
jgi:ATP-dependent exoDNAse (exonuclease V) alpha subunit